MPGEASPTGALHPDMLVENGGHLALFLGGSPDSFTGMLIHLIAKGDPENRAKLRLGFPDQVLAWELWSGMEDIPTAMELVTVIALAAG